MGAPHNGIKVFLRVRPTKNDSKFLHLDPESPGKVEVNVPQSLAATHVNNTKTNYSFRFDGVVDQDAKQEEVFDRVARDATLNALEGFNATVFAYGQTGSGKTFTMTGGAERYVDRGIIPRALSLVFEEIEKRSDVQVTAHISYLEIYNEAGYDLLDPSHETKAVHDLPKVSMMEDEDGNVHLNNLSMHVVNSEEDALNLLFLGDTNRAVSETAMNLASSRSHCIFTISLEMRQAGSDVIRRSKLHLVDLAGSERVHKTNSNGMLLREAKAINTSLHFLEMVIVALHERTSRGRQHIPYRNSMMTNVLRDSLGGNCKTSMIATISAERSNIEESIATCRFAQRVALVENDALVNEELDPTMLIKRLKAEVAALREELAFLKGERDVEGSSGARIDQLERKRMKGIIQDWVDSDPGQRADDVEGKDGGDGADGAVAPLNVGELTFQRIHAAFEILREIARHGEASAASTGTPGGAGNGAAAEEISQLRQQIQQRDNEIAILVKMVKQGGHGLPEVAVHGAERPQDSEEMPTRAHKAQGLTSQTPPRNRPRAAGAPIPPSQVLADKQRSLEHFKLHYPQLRAINENKRMLKERYALAKQTGERVNAARAEINKLKSEVEQLRRQSALRSLSGEGKEAVDEAKVDADPREAECLQQIESHKAAYKSNFQALKDLKKEIERIQAMLGKSRVKMQKDFEAWYAVVLREGLGDLPSPRQPRQQRQPPLPETRGVLSPKLVAVARTADPRTEEPAASPGLGSPKRIPLTGNQEADADIRAFYEAKEQLMMRRSKLK